MSLSRQAREEVAMNKSNQPSQIAWSSNSHVGNKLENNQMFDIWSGQYIDQITDSSRCQVREGAVVTKEEGNGVGYPATRPRQAQQLFARKESASEISDKYGF